MSNWQPRETMPDHERVLIWVKDNHLPGVRFGSAYRLSDGRLVAKPEGGNGDWTDSITHWQPVPEGPK